MRAAHYKSGDFGIELTQAEVDKLGGFGATCSISMISNGSDGEPAEFVLRPTKSSSTSICRLTGHNINSTTGGVGMIRWHRPGFSKLKDFGMMPVEADFQLDRRQFVFTIDLENARPARARGRGKATSIPAVTMLPNDKWEDQLKYHLNELNKLLQMRGEDQISVTANNRTVRVTLQKEF